METGLDRYQQKRNFRATPEPKGRTRRKARGALSFVIQKHAASHLHYDFRLELDGTLKSWAIPKGPSLDPKDKRLAMQVEDHPLEYADFEGTIPPGNYGAGTVIVWDRGEWIPKGDPAAGLARGKLEFELRGTKLAGHWVLVKTRGRNDREKRSAWLLIKERDDEARRTVTDMPKGAVGAPLPLTLQPQLAMLVDDVPQGGDWIYELKFDGYRVLARVDGGEVRLFTRNGNDWTPKLKHLATALARLGLDNAWLDGEIVIVGKNGHPDFQALQNAFESARTGQIQYCLFDLPYLDGHDLRAARLEDRREKLGRLLDKVQAPLFFSRSLEMTGPQLLKNACEIGLEGLIGKRRGSPYQSTRSRDWIKLKCLQRQEFVIGGYTESKRPGAGSFGALLLGVHEKDGSLRYAGKVGTGFTQTSLRELLKKMKPLARDTMPFDTFTGERVTKAIHWIEPKLVGEVAFAQWTTGGHVRHASFQGLRADKSARAVMAELPVPAAKVAPKKVAGRAKSKTAETAAIQVTHGARVVDPASGFTKQDLFDFYGRVAPQLLVHLRDRPVALVRAPQGIDGQLFFQKHLGTVKVPHVVEVDQTFFPGHPPLILVDSEPAVLACAQMNVIEFHTWNARVGDGVHPDRMVFDLDPGEGIVWKQVQDGARLMKGMLDQLHLKCFLKTSGGKGLHVVVPLQPRYDWDTVKDFSAAIVRHLAKTLPTLFVAKSGPRNRVGRIFIDYLRNGLGATTVCAFSVRARARLGVSIPVEWGELDELRAGDHWTVANAEERLGYRDVWSGYTRAAQKLERAMKLLGYEG